LHGKEHWAAGERECCCQPNAAAALRPAPADPAFMGAVMLDANLNLAIRIEDALS
jgi:hypothetical protein